MRGGTLWGGGLKTKPPTHVPLPPPQQQHGGDRVPSFAALHIRRTDKANEAFLYTTTEYIQMLVRSKAPKDVFILTDDQGWPG